MKWTWSALVLVILAALFLCVTIIVQETGSSSSGLPPAPESTPESAQSKESGSPIRFPTDADQPVAANPPLITRPKTRSAPLPGQSDPADPLARCLLGLVKDTEGKPLPGIRVFLADPPGKSGPKPMETRTDSRGQFRLGPLDLDQRASLYRSFQVEVTAFGY